MATIGSRLVTLAIYGLVALAALALPLEASESIHIHHGEAPALYNGECLLAALAAFHGLGLLPSVPLSVWTGLALGATAVFKTSNLAAPLTSHTASRAPPLV